MLRIVASRSAEQALSYYGEALSREDYYSGEMETAGKWGGDAARRLGLTGDVAKDAFKALTENRNPATGERLTARHSEDRRVGYDFSFHCPKSVSLAYELTGDKHIRDAFEASVRATMLDIEQEMKTRVRLEGKQEDRETGNIAWAEFIHRTARPVGGVPDPHLHAHCFVFNATFDKAENRWKAGQFGDIKRDAPYYEACFHARLSERMTALGYEVERGRRGWELAGISRSMIEKFSKRTALIEETAKSLGITDKKQLDQLGGKTREGKRKDLTPEALKAEWEARLTPEEREMIRGVEKSKGRLLEPNTSARDCIQHAEAHVFERASVVAEKRLLTEALWRGVGSVGVQQVQREFETSGFLRTKHDGERVCTTMEILAEERAMVESVKFSRGTCKALVPGDYQFIQESLGDEQRKAVLHVLGSIDRVTGIRGGAGTGKTTLMREAITAMRGAGHEVFVFAPSSEASRGVLRQEGFLNAETVAHLLLNTELQDRLQDQVIWIDEAGLLGTRTMKRVIDLAREKNARLILSGDTRQHRSVERGDSLRILEENAGLVCAELKKIHRQSGEYREAIEYLSEGRIESGFAKLDAIGAIRELDTIERYEELANDYVGAVQKEESVLIVSPTHTEAQMATAAVREGLRRIGKLGAAEDERTIPTFTKVKWTDAEKADPVNYRPGLHVEFQLNAPGFKKASKWIVDGVEEGAIALRNREGTTAKLPLGSADRFDVFEGSELRVAPGDLLHFRRGGQTAARNSFNAGLVHQLDHFDDNGDLVLTNGWTIPANFGHVGHGYVLTSHASQGKTTNHLLIAQGSESWGASSAEQFYVSTSRGRKSVKIYTDSREELLEAVLGSSRRLSAVELDGAWPARHPELRTIPLREHERIADPQPAAPRPPTPAPGPQPDVAPIQPPPVTTPRPDQIERVKELLAKYGQPRVDSSSQAAALGERERQVIEKYSGRTMDDGRSNEQERRRRERDRSE